MKFLLTSIEAEDMFLCSLIRTTRLLAAEWPIGIFCWRDGLSVLTAGQISVSQCGFGDQLISHWGRPRVQSEYFKPKTCSVIMSLVIPHFGRFGSFFGILNMDLRPENR